MKSLRKVLDIIETVAEAGNAGIRELSSLTGFPPATIHRIVSTLVDRQYFKQDPTTRSYSLSLRFLELGTRVQRQFNFATIARPHLEKLMAETKESVNLAVQDGDAVVYLEHVQSNYSMLHLFTRPGARVPLYATGVGKMFLSQWSQNEIDAYLQRTERRRYTRYTLVDKDEMLDELRRIRERGFSVDNEEMEEGIRCVAALVFDHNNRPAAAVSISGVAMRIAPERLEALGQCVKNCTLAISRELGFNVTPKFNTNKRKETGHA